MTAIKLRCGDWSSLQAGCPGSSCRSRFPSYFIPHLELQVAGRLPADAANTQPCTLTVKLSKMRTSPASAQTGSFFGFVFSNVFQSSEKQTPHEFACGDKRV